MPLWGSTLDRLPGNRHRITAEVETLEEGRRQPLSTAVKAQVLKYFPALDEAALEGYTFEKRRTPFEDAQYDLLVYNDQGKLKYYGRAFNTSIYFWTA